MEDFLAGSIAGVIVTVVAFFLFIDIGGTYKQGQIDALTGKIKYELVTHPDKTQTWEVKEKK